MTQHDIRHAIFRWTFGSLVTFKISEKPNISILFLLFLFLAVPISWIVQSALNVIIRAVFIIYSNMSSSNHFHVPPSHWDVAEKRWNRAEEEHARVIGFVSRQGHVSLFSFFMSLCQPRDAFGCTLAFV